MIIISKMEINIHNALSFAVKISLRKTVYNKFKRYMYNYSLYYCVLYLRYVIAMYEHTVA